MSEKLFWYKNHDSWDRILSGELGLIAPRKITPWKINMEPENDDLVQMIFLYNWVIFWFHVHHPGCNPLHSLKK